MTAYSRLPGPLLRQPPDTSSYGGLSSAETVSRFWARPDHGPYDPPDYTEWVVAPQKRSGAARAAAVEFLLIAEPRMASLASSPNGWMRLSTSRNRTEHC
jgi:hypothetical protein